MKKIMIVLIISVVTLMTPPLASAVMYTDRTAWETAVGGNFLDVALPGIEGTTLPAWTSITLPYGGFFNFGVPLERMDYSSLWQTWSSPPPIKLLYTETPDGNGNYYANGSFYPNGVSSGIVSAFGFEMQPNLKAIYTINLYITDGNMISQSVNGDSGARFFGWVGNNVIGFSTWASTNTDGYAMGRFVQGSTQVPEPTTMLLLGLGLVGLAGVRGRMRM